ncbi:MAG: tRNA 2-thiocytidine(32) synthetase TtcA [Bdellovibrio sp.]|jgi:tRNA 2-thiocytidine biosynthesis protein TtcA
MPIQFDHPTAISIRKQMVRAIADYKLIEEGDKVMVCTSGGKDSSILLALLMEIRRRAPFDFDVEAVILDQKQPGFNVTAFKSWVETEVGARLHVVERDTYSIVTEKVTNGVYCSLCSRLRRAILYDYASVQGFTKMALGHHRDDSNQTLLLNLFYSGKLSAMPPKLKSDDGRNIVIRPLINVPEADLISLGQDWSFPVIPCNLCGSQEGMKRQKMKKLLTDLEKDIPAISASMLTAQANLRPSQLMDKDRWDFDALIADGQPTSSGVDFLTGLPVGGI